MSATVGGEDGEAGVVAFAVSAAVWRWAEEEEVVDSVAQFGGEEEEVDGCGAGWRRVVVEGGEGKTVGEREVVEWDGEGLGETFGPGGCAVGRYGHYEEV